MKVCRTSFNTAMVTDPENIDIDLLSDVLDESIVWISERTGYSVSGIIPLAAKLLCRLSKDSGINAEDGLADTAIDSVKKYSSHVVESVAVPIVVPHVDAKRIRHHDETASERINQLEMDNREKACKIQELSDAIGKVELQYEKRMSEARESNERILHQNRKVFQLLSSPEH